MLLLEKGVSISQGILTVSDTASAFWDCLNLRKHGGPKMNDKSMQQLVDMIASRLISNSAINPAMRGRAVASASASVYSRQLGAVLASVVSRALDQALRDSAITRGSFSASSGIPAGMAAFSAGSAPLRRNRRLMSDVAGRIGANINRTSLASALAQRLQKPEMSPVGRLMRFAGGDRRLSAASPGVGNLMLGLVASRVADQLMSQVASGMMPALDSEAVASAVADKLRSRMDKLEKLQPTKKVSASKAKS
jgi:hypothetical protein